MINRDEFIKSGWHWSFGWLRRSELDEDGAYCYEDGDGDLIYSQRKDHHLICYLDCWKDRKTGEKYLTLNPSPVSEKAIECAKKIDQRMSKS
jgi:hypothetical protein